MIYFTSDIDWAPEQVIEDTLNLFEEANVKCTLFVTHDSEVIKNCNRDLFEIAIHPNFNPLLDGKGGSVSEVLDNLLEIYPEAKGVRSHSMTQSSIILDWFVKKGMVYDSNHFWPYHQGLKPFKLWNGLLRIPYNWEDDVHFTYGYPFSDCKIDLDQDGLKVFDFHPVHVYLNTENLTRIQNAKQHYQDPDGLLKHRNNSDIPGSRDLLINLLKYVNDNNIERKTLIALAEDHL